MSVISRKQDSAVRKWNAHRHVLQRDQERGHILRHGKRIAHHRPDDQQYQADAACAPVANHEPKFDRRRLPRFPERSDPRNCPGHPAGSKRVPHLVCAPVVHVLTNAKQGGVVHGSAPDERWCRDERIRHQRRRQRQEHVSRNPPVHRKKKRAPADHRPEEPRPPPERLIQENACVSIRHRCSEQTDDSCRRVEERQRGRNHPNDDGHADRERHQRVHRHEFERKLRMNEWTSREGERQVRGRGGAGRGVQKEANGNQCNTSPQKPRIGYL